MTAHQNRWRSHLLNLLERFLEAAGQAQVVRRKEKALRPAQRKLEKALARAFRKQGAAVVAALTKVSGDFPAEEARRIREAPRDYLPLIDRALDETAEAFIEAIEPAVQAALLAGGEVLLDLIDDLPDNIAFNLKNPRAVAYMRQYGARQVAAINEATRSYLQTILTEATENGWSWQRTAEAITERYQEFAAGVPGPKHIQSRAELIAVTETGNAYEAGNEMAAAHLVDARAWKWRSPG